MIAVDTNILVYAHRADAPFHGDASRCIRSLAESRAAWAIPWPCLHEFYAIATHPRIYDPPSTIEQAAGQISAWVESPSLTLLAEAAEHLPALLALLRRGRVTGPLVHDARVAALCVTHGVRELWTVDRDFGRFPELRTTNPLTTDP